MVRSPGHVALFLTIDGKAGKSGMGKERQGAGHSGLTRQPSTGYNVCR